VSAISAYKRDRCRTGDVPKVSIGTGAQAGNPWLQELPDPVSKATWDNYAIISIKKQRNSGSGWIWIGEYYPKTADRTHDRQKQIGITGIGFPGMQAEIRLLWHWGMAEIGAMGLLQPE
jgi:molybdopterin-containing oxidoreductase family iron-sulfur binding subunit